MSDLVPEAPFTVSSLLPEEVDPQASADELEALGISLEAERREDDLVVSAPPPPPIGRSWAYDFHQHRFVIGPGGHGPAETHGGATLRTWIEKTINTARGAHPIYSDFYGVDEPFREIGQPLAFIPASDYPERVKTALIYHPRIIDVRDFRITTDPDDEAFLASFTVVLDDDSALLFNQLRIA